MAADPAGESWRRPDLSGETLAFLQYTSGSTTAPRGVMVRHRNILANERMIQAAYGHTEATTFVGWLPLFHDMGLIGNILQPLFIGSRCVFMAPLTFLRRPLRWLSAISRYGGRTCGGPSFAYDLCVRRTRVEERQTLDLSGWTVAYVGAEPVRADVLDRFAEAFAPAGFLRRAFHPCYGLAEATLFVTGSSSASGAPALALDRQSLQHHRIVPATDAATAKTLVTAGPRCSTSGW